MIEAAAFREASDGFIIAEINTSAYILKDKEERGEVDQGAVTDMRAQLKGSSAQPIGRVFNILDFRIRSDERLLMSLRVHSLRPPLACK